VKNGRLFLDIEVQGRKVRALLDSAAEATLIDQHFAAELGLKVETPTQVKGSGGNVDAAFARGVTIKATGIALGPLEVGVLDLSDVAARLVGGPLPVILGREYFDAARLAIDIDGGTLRVLSANDTPRGVQLSLTKERGVETVPVSVEGHIPASAAFDLGNGGAVLVGKAYADSLELLTDGRKLATSIGGGIGGAKAQTTFTLRSLAIAGKTITDVPAQLDNTDSATDLNIGVPVLRHFRIVTDFAGRRIWLDAI
jgi:hypothetical protein